MDTNNINTTPQLLPRVRVYTGTMAQLLASGRKWKSYEWITPDDQPDVLYRGTLAGDLFSNLKPYLGGIKVRTSVAKNVTATLVPSDVKGGLITTTAAAAETLTLPTLAAILAAYPGQFKQGASLEFTIDNSTGANAVTVAVGANITAATAVITGADNLVVAAGKVGTFKLYFKITTPTTQQTTAPTAALLSRTL